MSVIETFLTLFSPSVLVIILIFTSAIYQFMTENESKPEVRQRPRLEQTKPKRPDAERSRTPAIGIDFGTSTSCVAAYHNGKVETFRNKFHNAVTPSVVAFNDQEILIGEAAVEQMMFNVENTVFDVKRLLGKTYEEMMDDRENWPFQITNESGQPKVMVRYKGSMQPLSPTEICSKILQRMKEMADNYFEMNITDAVITIPSYFNNLQSQAMMEAAWLTGLNVLGIFHEPTAAAIAYRQNKNAEKQEENILVFHLGGGTFDVSVLRTIGQEFRSIGNVGNPRFGGKEFDSRILNHFIEEFEKQFDRDVSENKRAIHTLEMASEKVKRELSEREIADIEINGLYEGIDFYTSLSREKFEELCADFFENIKVSIDNVLRDANLQSADIGQVVLVGGSTDIPKVKEIVSKSFSKRVMESSAIRGNEAIVHGAAILAAILNGNIPELLPPIEQSF